MFTALPAAGTGAWPDGLPYDVADVLPLVADADAVVVFFEDAVEVLGDDVDEAFAAAAFATAAAAAARLAARERLEEVWVAVPVDGPLAAGGTVPVTALFEAAAGAAAFTAFTA